MTSRASRVTVAFALVASLLVVGAQPAAASHGLVVASSHSTDTDFNAADTLDNMTVVGSGSAATVELTGGPSSTYSIVDTQGDGATDIGRGLIGDDTSNSVLSSEYRFEPDVSGNVENVTLQVAGTTGSDYGFTVDVYIVDEAPDQVYGEGTLVADDYDPDFATGAQTIDISPYAVTAGDTYTLEIVPSGSDGGGDTDTINIDTDTSATATWITRSDSSTFDAYADLDFGIGNASDIGTYISANHTAEDTEQGFVNITELTNATATVTWETSNGGAWSTINQTDVTTVANHTFSWPVEANETVRVNVTVVNQTGNGLPAFTMASEGVLFDAAVPVVDNSSASPTGQLTTAPSTLSVDISDVDFGDVQGDSVDVEFVTNTSGTVGTDTLTANGSASASLGSTPTEPVKWWVVATDEYGHSTRSANFTFQPPSELSVYNESAVVNNGTLTSAELVDEVNVTIRMVQDDGTLIFVERSTSDGTIDMSGLDPTQPFVAIASAENYTDRRIFVESLYDSQQIFLLPTSETFVTQTFELVDYSGDFPADETVLDIQRPLNGSWRTVEADYFGATSEMSATLAYNARHRFVLRNVETGETRNIGIYQPISSEDKTLEVTEQGDVSFVELNPIIAFDPFVDSLPATTTSLAVDVGARDTALTSYNVTILHRNESGNTTLATFSGSNGDGEEFTANLDLTNRTGNVTVVVEWSTSEASGSTTRVFGIHEYFANQNSLLAVLGDVEGALNPSTAGMFMTLVAVLSSIMAMLVVASTFPASGEEIGAVGLIVLTGWAVVGWLGWDVITAVGLAYVGTVAIRRRV